MSSSTKRRRAALRRLLIAFVAASALLGASAAAAPASGGSGTVTAGGQVGQLQVNASGLSEVLAFAGQPQAQLVTHVGSGRMFDALGYGCTHAKRGIEAPIGTGEYCHTAFYVDIATNTLEQFFTTSARYHDAHGVHVGISTAAAEHQEHHAAAIGCGEGMAIHDGNSSLVIGMAGGHRSHSGRLVGGHVSLLAVDSALRRPGVFVCI